MVGLLAVNATRTTREQFANVIEVKKDAIPRNQRGHPSFLDLLPEPSRGHAQRSCCRSQRPQV
jgi:hypothetical protein